MLFREGPDAWVIVYLLKLSIFLCSYKSKNCIFVAILNGLGVPVFQFLKRCQTCISIYVLCDIIDKKNSCWTSVEGFYDRAKRFHASGIPNLHFNAIIFIHFDLLRVEFYSQSSSISIFELIFGESVEEATFANTRRADYYHFEGLLILLFHWGIIITYKSIVIYVKWIFYWYW